MVDFAADTLAIFSGPLGKAASFTPDGGEAVAIRVIPDQPDDVMQFAGSQIVGASARFKIPVSQVASPQPGDVITLDSVTYTIQGAPRRDHRQLWWAVETSVTAS